MSEPFGQWLTDPKTGTAHYVLGDRCLCGAAVKKFGGPPERKPLSAPGAGVGAFVTPLCVDCLDLNVARWQKTGGRADTKPSKPQRAFWWRQKRFRKS